MLVHCDVRGLEIVTAGYLSQDPVLCEEIRTGFDTHEDNRKRCGFPEGKEGRTIAKRFVFQILYGGTAFGFTQKPDFTVISKSEKFWQKLVDGFYDKYRGIHKWHTEIIQTVQKSGQLIMPTGRVYQFKRYPNARGEMNWPLTQIKNYPVQGLGADLVAIGRVALWRRIKKSTLSPVLFQSTVHDSIDLDTTSELCYNICMMAKKAIEDIPMNFERLFGVKFNLPLNAEVGYGPTLGDLKTIE